MGARRLKGWKQEPKSWGQVLKGLREELVSLRSLTTEAASGAAGEFAIIIPLTARDIRIISIVFH